jgi:alpha-D-ribose 1-methylphosphonate 5-phosphate C-P lyase
MDNSPVLQLFGAGREKRIYAIPPYTSVKPLKFDDREFKVESFSGISCERCGAQNVFFDEVRRETGNHYFCSDTEYCDQHLEKSNAS